MINLSPVTVSTLHMQELQEKKIRADVLRLDGIHPVISGNKWFKLKYYFEEARQTHHESILTFGGAYSNHLVATACAAREMGFKSIGVIRTERPRKLSHTLQQCMGYGMKLEFVTRDEFKKRSDTGFLADWIQRFPGSFAIPEGGAGENGIRGSAEILDGIEMDRYSHIVCAVGTGTMFAGLANAALPDQELLGICVLKGMQSEYGGMPDHIKNNARYQINHDYHFEGYAKRNDALIRFMNDFYRQTNIRTDFVYTGKLFYGIFDLLRKNHLKNDSSLLIIHSGGLQGNGSLPDGTLIF